MSRLVQIDESIFASKRKYNRGRLLKDNEKHKKVPVEDNKEKAINEKNYGRRLSGKWIFGLALHKILEGRRLLEQRYFKVEMRDVKTLLPIIMS